MISQTPRKLPPGRKKPHVTTEKMPTRPASNVFFGFGEKHENAKKFKIHRSTSCTVMAHSTSAEFPHGGPPPGLAAPSLTGWSQGLRVCAPPLRPSGCPLRPRQSAMAPGNRLWWVVAVEMIAMTVVAAVVAVVWAGVLFKCPARGVGLMVAPKSSLCVPQILGKCKGALWATPAT